MQAALPLIRIALPALLTVCIIIGTFGVQFKYDIDGTSFLWVYFYMETGAYDNPVYFSKVGWKLFGCPAPFHLINSALAMGVIGCASSLAAVATSALLFKAPTNAPIVLASRVSCFFATLTIFATLTLAVVFYTSKFCNANFYLSDDWSLGYGFIFLVISATITSLWCLLEIIIAVTRSGGRGGAIDEITPLNA